MRHPVHGPLVGDEAGHAHFVASLTHRTTARFKTSRSIRSWAFSARNRLQLRDVPCRKPLRVFVLSAVLSNPVTQGARVDTQVARYLGDRLTRLTDDADRTLPELRIELEQRATPAESRAVQGDFTEPRIAVGPERRTARPRCSVTAHNSGGADVAPRARSASPKPTIARGKHPNRATRFHELHPARTATLIPLDARSGITIFGTSSRRGGMRSTRLVAPLVAAGVIALGISTSTAWAGGPGGAIEDSNDISVAVGTGVFVDGLVGFKASGATNEEASAQVIAQCQSAGGQECTSDEVTNDNLCIVSVGDDSNEIVAGGAGVTVEAARDDAFQRAAANGTPLGPTAAIVISDCH